MGIATFLDKLRKDYILLRFVQARGRQSSGAYREKKA
jgi:hypothetical protein